MISIPIQSRLWLSAGLIALVAACGGPGKPSVTLTATPTSLEDGQIVTLKATVAGGAGKMMVEFYKDGQKVGTDDTAPYETSLPLTANDNVTLAFTAKAIAANGQDGISSAVNVELKVDKEPPQVELSVSSPQLNSVGSITLMAKATDNKNVVKVEFFKGSTKIGESTTPTNGVYSLNVPLDANDNGTQKYSAKAYDAKGNVGTAEANVSVDIDVTPPTVSLSSNKTSVTTAGSATLTANASDNKGVTKVEFYKGDDKIGEDSEAPYTMGISYTHINNGNHTYSAKAYDAKNNSTMSGSVTISVDIDATLPAVSIGSDKPSITAAGSATLTAQASDDKGVTKVEFYEGTTKLFEDTEAPYEHVLNFPFSEANNGNHSYTAKAYDGNSNNTESDPVVINVDIDATAPSFTSFTATPGSLSATGSVTLTAEASDAKGVAKIEFYKGNDKIGEDTEAPYTAQVDYNASYKATDSFSAKAFDAAGNSATSAAADVSIDIDITNPQVTLNPSTAKLEAPGTVTLSAANSDNQAVTKLEFYQVGNPTPLKTVDAPVANPETYDLSYDHEDNGSYTFMVKAYDAKGNVASSEATVVVEVKPNITKFGVATGSSLDVSDAGGVINLEWEGEYAVSYTLSVSPDNTAYTTIPGPGNTAGFVHVQPNPTNESRSYTVTVKAKAYGSGIPDDEATLTVTVAPDTTAPTNVALSVSESEVTEPTTVDLEATADDNHAVTKVEFFKNGNSIGEDTDSEDGFTLTADIVSGDVGTAVFSAKAFDAAGNSATSADENVTVNAAMSFTSAYTNAALTVGRPYTSATPVVSGGTGDKTFSVAPALPADLIINDSTGVISGTPSAPSANTTYTVTVTDEYGATKTTTLDIKVNAAPSVGTNYTSPAIAAVGRLFTSSTPVVADGTAPFTFTVSPGLPGLSISSSTGVISGTPSSETTEIPYTVTATDANGATVAFTISIDINTAPTLSYTTYRNLTVGRTIQKANFVNNNNYNVSTGGGTGTKTYQVVGGSLPGGMGVDNADGDITGAPTGPGSFSATIRVTDAAGYYTDATFSIAVNAAPTLSFTRGADVTGTGTDIIMDNDSITQNEVIATFSSANGVGTLSYSDGGGNGNLFNPRFSFSGSGVITSDQTGNSLTIHTGFTRTFTVTDANGASTSVTLNFVIND